MGIRNQFSDNVNILLSVIQRLLLFLLNYLTNIKAQTFDLNGLNIKSIYSLTGSVKAKFSLQVKE